MRAGKTKQFVQRHGTVYYDPAMSLRAKNDYRIEFERKPHKGIRVKSTRWSRLRTRKYRVLSATYKPGRVWTEEEKHAALERAAGKETHGSIALALGRSEKALNSAVKRYAKDSEYSEPAAKGAFCRSGVDYHLVARAMQTLPDATGTMRQVCGGVLMVANREKRWLNKTGAPMQKGLLRYEVATAYALLYRPEFVEWGDKVRPSGGGKLSTVYRYMPPAEEKAQEPVLLGKFQTPNRHGE